MKFRIINILVAFDQLAWVLITAGYGMPDETISAAAWRMDVHGKWQGRFFRPLIDFLFSPFEKNHCMHAFLAEMKKAQLPEEYKKQ